MNKIFKFSLMLLVSTVAYSQAVFSETSKGEEDWRSDLTLVETKLIVEDGLVVEFRTYTNDVGEIFKEVVQNIDESFPRNDIELVRQTQLSEDLYCSSNKLQFQLFAMRHNSQVQTQSLEVVLNGEKINLKDHHLVEASFLNNEFVTVRSMCGSESLEGTLQGVSSEGERANKVYFRADFKTSEFSSYAK